MASPGTVVGVQGVTCLRGSGTQSFQRPNNTTAYTAGDVVSDSATSFTPILKFPIARAAGGAGYIVKAQLDTNLKTYLSQMRLYLFTRQAGIVVAGDNVAGTQLFANQPYALGYLDFPTLVSGAGAGSTGATALFTGNVEFRCEAGDDSVYGYLVDATGGTPAAFQTFAIQVEADVYG